MTATARATPKPVATREITVTRTFAAPRPLVFSMFTDARHLARWWGPHGFTNPLCEADARPGGSIRIDMRAPDGTVHPMGGIFHEISPHDRIVFTSFVDLPDGQRILEGRNTVTFEERRRGTKVTVCARAECFVDFAVRMLAGMEAGWSQSLDKLAGDGERIAGVPDVDDKMQIRAIFADRANALFCKSVDLAVRHLAEDFVSYDLDPPLAHLGPGREQLQQWFDTWDGPIAWAMGDLTVEAGGDIAFAHGLGHMLGIKTDGAKADLWTRVTVCLMRRDGAWKITHQHTSVPFHMDGSFKAAVDLRP